MVIVVTTWDPMVSFRYLYVSKIKLNVCLDIVLKDVIIPIRLISHDQNDRNDPLFLNWCWKVRLKIHKNGDPKILMTFTFSAWLNSISYCLPCEREYLIVGLRRTLYVKNKNLFVELLMFHFLTLSLKGNRVKVLKTFSLFSFYSLVKYKVNDNSRDEDLQIYHLPIWD